MNSNIMGMESNMEQLLEKVCKRSYINYIRL